MRKYVTQSTEHPGETEPAAARSADRRPRGAAGAALDLEQKRIWARSTQRARARSSTRRRRRAAQRVR
eukprot:2347100-Prymnesium_polylepis.2